ncbi:MAG: ribosome recycling factor [Acidobacteria bacterium]|nr:ribosome recycling factor [Acidobacteriota bacterium]
MLEEVLKQTEEKMEMTLLDFEQELKSVRTGRASVHLVDPVRVDYYGTMTPLNQLATISTPDPTLIVIQPWDVSSIGAIEKAIQQSDLGITPSNDGKVIRLPVPPLTEERRKQLVKNVHQMSEQHRIAVRQNRQTARDQIQKLEKDKEISEDQSHKGQDRVQSLTDEYVKKIDELTKKKETELMKI